MMLRKKPKTYPIIDPPRIPIIQSKNSFEELRLPISYTVFVLINSVLNRVDHDVRYHPVHLAEDSRLKVSVHILVVNRSVPFLPLAVSTFLHIEESDVNRIAHLDATVLGEGKVIERLLQPSGALLVCRRGYLSLMGQELRCLVLEECADLMSELIRNHNALFPTKISIFVTSRK